MDFSFLNRFICALPMALAVAGTSLMLPAAYARPATPEVSAAVVSQDVYPQHRVIFPGGVTGLPDIIYTCQLGFRPLTLDLYLPPNTFKDKGPRPFVVYVHGGGCLGGSSRTTGAFANWPEALASIAAKGYVVASISYRLSKEAPFPAAIYDVKDAVRWIRSKAETFNIDKSRGLIWGSSAGGHLAALAAASCDVKTLDRPVETNQAQPAAGESACLQGAVIWYGVSDFAPLSSMPEAEQFLDCRGYGCTEVRRAASPVTYVNAEVPPFLIIHGTEDQTVPVRQAKELYDVIKAQKGNAELLLIPGINHSFFGKTPKATHDASLQAWERTVAFIDQTIGDNKQR
ncbi:MAG: alpha/beta hydrolase [Syntrophobacteraceae bacterium]